MVVVRFFTPFMCVASLAVVVLYPDPWQVAHVARDAWNECLPVAGGMPWQVVHDAVGGGGGVQVCDSTGVPAQPAGEDDAVRVCVPPAEQVLHAEYVYVQTGGT
jgi:hypothetical protein